MTDEERFNGSLLNSVWQVCEKIRKVLEKEDFNLRNLFRNFDTRETGLVEESQFFSVLMENMREILTLNESEIKSLSNYFKLRNGKIHYKQFCDIMDDFSNKIPADVSKYCRNHKHSEHKNMLSNYEEHHICLLLSKIANSIRLREVALKPYFEDYEVIAKNNGTVTFSHLYRILHFLGIELSIEDFQILVKKYMQDSYTINYVSFVKDIEIYVSFFDRNRPHSYKQDVAQNYPGKFIEIKIPNIKRSEVETGNWILGRPTTCHPSVTSQFYQRNRPCINLNTIFETIQNHVVRNKINIKEYFYHFDSFYHGCVTKSQFRRALEAIGVTGLNRIYWSEEEIERLCEVFAKEENPELINWKLFKDEIDCGYLKGNCNSLPIKDITQEDIENQIKCHNIVSKIQNTINRKMFSPETFFKDFDRHNSGYITVNQYYQVLSQIGTFLTGQEIQAIEQKYSNFKGFHYIPFLKDIEPQIVIRPKYENFVQRKILVNCRTLHEPSKDETDIVEILANIKSQVVKKRINILQFMSGFDPINHQVITCSEFKRSLRNADVILTDNEMNVLCMMFKAPLRDGYVDYIRFCDLIEEVFTQKRLLQAPLIVPLQHLPSNDGVENNLTIDERTVVSKVLKKLSAYHDTISNLSELFKNYDKTRCGTVTKQQLTKILILRDIRMLSQHEIDILHKCFNKKNRFVYRDFLNALKLVANAQIQLPF